MNSHPVKVLVIDDNPEHVAFLERLLGLSPAGADFDLYGSYMLPIARDSP